MIRIGIAGLGFVGGALAQALRMNDIPYAGYDPGKGFPNIELLKDCELIFLVVGTPEVQGDLDNEAVHSVVAQLAELCAWNTIVAIKSTVPPGTNDALATAYPNLRFASVPEFLVQAEALDTLLNPDRIVIGARDEVTAGAIANVLLTITNRGELVLVKPIEAELLKLCANTLLASKVAIANELFDICAAYGVEWDAIRPGIGLDSRIGPAHLEVTEERGYGGACFPKDLRGLIAAAERMGRQPNLLRSIERENARVRARVSALLPHGAGENIVVRQRGSA